MAGVTAQCVRCGRPLTDAANICRPEAQELADALLAAAGHAEDAETVIARQTRYSGAARATRERPLPVDLTAASRYAIAENTIGTWAQHVVEERGTELPARRPTLGPLCELPLGCGHDSCEAIQRRIPPARLADAALWLAGQIDWLRKRPEADEAFDELHDACGVLARLVDRPGGAGMRLVGMCDCGKILYAPHGRDVVQCKASNCGASWNVTESQQILRDALDERLVTGAEAAHLGAWLDTDRTQKQLRALVDVWARRRVLTAHGEVAEPHRPRATCEEACELIWDWIPTYRFGDIAARIATTPRRAARAAESETAA